MSARGEVNLFSTSFIDMICVALCSQIILWVIASDEEAPRPTPPPKVRYFELVQFGYCHLCELQDDKGKKMLVPATLHLAGAPEELHFRVPAKHSLHCQRIDTATVQWLEAVPDAFTGGLRIMAPTNCKPFTITIPIGNCGKNDLHYIRGESSFLGKPPLTQYFLCHFEDSLKKITGLPLPANKWPAPSFVDQLTGLKSVPFNSAGVTANVYRAAFLKITVPATGLINVKSVYPSTNLTDEFRKNIRGY